MPYPYQYIPNMQPTQMRLNQLEQQYPQFSQGMQAPYQSFQQPMIIKGRPVSSYDEAKASMIDLDGSVFMFPDYGNGKIYTKQINLDGTATIKTYRLDEDAKSAPGSAESSKSSPNTTELINGLQSQIDVLKDKIERLQMGRGEKNAEPVHSDDAIRKHDEKSKSGNR